MENKIKIITEYCGKIDLKNIENYISLGGYESLEKFVSEMTSKKAIEEIKISGLCGRGGSGFPTGVKLESVFKAKGPARNATHSDAGGDEKYLICNLDESEPGTYKDRFIVDYNPIFNN
jgi:NADH:ubiquinone oxidoreductase subunit F (NADH-binding)